MNTRASRCHVTQYATRQPSRRRYCATVIARKSPSVRMPNRRQCSRAKWVAAATSRASTSRDHSKYAPNAAPRTGP